MGEEGVVLPRSRVERAARRSSEKDLPAGVERGPAGQKVPQLAPHGGPYLPALLALEDRDRGRDGSIGRALEVPGEQRLELARLQAERRAALAVFEEEEPGDPALRRKQPGSALHVSRP